MDWAKETAASTRAALKQAQRDGVLDAGWTFSVRKHTASQMMLVSVTVTNATPELMLTAGGRWTDLAHALTCDVLDVTGDQWRAATGPVRYFELHFGAGCPEPPMHIDSAGGVV